MKITITFDKSLSEEILRMFNKKVDKEGRIVEEDGSPVFTPEGEELNIDEFAGTSSNPKMFIKSDLPSLIDFSKRHSKR